MPRYTAWMELAQMAELSWFERALTSAVNLEQLHRNTGEPGHCRYCQVYHCRAWRNAVARLEELRGVQSRHGVLHTAPDPRTIEGVVVASRLADTLGERRIRALFAGAYVPDMSSASV